MKNLVIASLTAMLSLSLHAQTNTSSAPTPGQASAPASQTASQTASPAVGQTGSQIVSQKAQMDCAKASECSSRPTQNYSVAMTSDEQLAAEPSSAGYAKPISRAQVINELSRARKAGELNWAERELGL